MAKLVCVEMTFTNWHNGATASDYSYKVVADDYVLAAEDGGTGSHNGAGMIPSAFGNGTYDVREWFVPNGLAGVPAEFQKEGLYQAFYAGRDAAAWLKGEGEAIREAQKLDGRAGVSDIRRAYRAGYRAGTAQRA